MQWTSTIKKPRKIVTGVSEGRLQRGPEGHMGVQRFGPAGYAATHTGDHDAPEE
jgi:hypothetical protein